MNRFSSNPLQSCPVTRVDMLVAKSRTELLQGTVTRVWFGLLCKAATCSPHSQAPGCPGMRGSNGSRSPRPIADRRRSHENCELLLETIIVGMGKGSSGDWNASGREVAQFVKFVDAHIVYLLRTTSCEGPIGLDEAKEAVHFICKGAPFEEGGSKTIGGLKPCGMQLGR